MSIGSLTALTILPLALLSTASRADGQDNLPIYTSPIDITGLRLQIQAVAPDVDTGKPVPFPFPSALLGPKINQVLSTPLSAQFDQAWAAQRANACDGPAGIKKRVQDAVKKIGESVPGTYNAYDISCNLAVAGRLITQQVGNELNLAYLLTNNRVDFAVSTPITCRSGHGTPFCPNDPRFNVTFATEIVTVLRAPDLCHIVADGSTVYTQSVVIDDKNVSGAVAVLLDGLFFGHQFPAAEQGIAASTSQSAVGFDAPFKELRDNGACTGTNTLAARELAPFADFEVIIDLRLGVIFRLGHVGIVTPALYPPSVGPFSQPTFFRPMIATPQPIVIAGNPVEVTGQYFPPFFNLATALPIGLQHGGYGPKAMSVSGVCFRGLTVVDWGRTGDPTTFVLLPGDAQGNCANSFYPMGLMPSTTYQFRARDCDSVTCSPWSPFLKARTSPVDPAPGRVTLTLDGGTPLGVTTVTQQGTFDTTITIPAGTTVGTHIIHAVGRDLKADVAIEVRSPGGGGKASILMVGVLKGETGCPNHPLTSTQTDYGFTLFGAGFPAAAGAVTIHLDTAGGSSLGVGTVRPDGSFCQVMAGVPAAQAGNHTLVAVQSGAVKAQTNVSFVLPSVIR